MNFPTVSLVYNRLGYKSKSGYSPVYIRLYISGKYDFIRIPNIPKIHMDSWAGDERKGLWVKDDALINETLSDLINETRKLISHKLIKDQHVTSELVRELLLNPQLNESFNEFALYYVNNINRSNKNKKKISFRTIQIYRTFISKLNDFNPKIKFRDLSPHLVESFDVYMINEYHLISTSRKKYFDKFKVIYFEACKKGHCELNPYLFSDLKFEDHKTGRVSLEMNEIKKLKYTVLDDPELEKYKSIFLFQCLTGLYFKDLKDLKLASFRTTMIEESNQNIRVWFLEGRRLKNEQKFIIKLFEDSMKILERYGNLTSNSLEQNLFTGLVSEQKYNYKLKLIGNHLKIQKHLTNKVGRHTYGEMMVSLDNSREKVGKAMGHNKEETTRRYSELSPTTALTGWKMPRI